MLDWSFGIQENLKLKKKTQKKYTFPLYLTSKKKVCGHGDTVGFITLTWESVYRRIYSINLTNIVSLTDIIILDLGEMMPKIFYYPVSDLPWIVLG